MPIRVKLARRLRSFLNECIVASSTETTSVTTIGEILKAWHLYCAQESWHATTYLRPDGLQRELTYQYKYDPIDAPFREPAWKCTILFPSRP